MKEFKPLSIVRKAAQAACIWGVALVIIGAFEREALQYPQLWCLACLGIFANVFQPSYSPLEGSRTSQDRGTAVQILYSVYGVQLLAVAEFLWRHPKPEMDGISYGALAVMLAGLSLRSWSVLILGRWFTWNVQVQEGQAVITSGPYRFIRHPSYTGAFLLFAGAPPFLHAWLATPIAAVILAVAFRRRIGHEEQLMRNELPGYEAYRARTGAMFPQVVSAAALAEHLRNSGRSAS